MRELSPPTIDQTIHDQLVTDLKEELNDQISHLLLENEAIKEKLDVKTFEHELNLIQFQRLKDDYKTLYQLIITFGNDPVTIPLHSHSIHSDFSPSRESTIKTTNPPPSFSADTTQVSSDSISPPPPFPSDSGILSSQNQPPESTSSISKKGARSTTPITPAAYKQRLSQVPRNSFLDLGEQLTSSSSTPSKSPADFEDKDPKIKPTQKSNHPSLNIPATSSPQQKLFPSVPATLTIGTQKQILAIKSIQPITPIYHPTIMDLRPGSPDRTLSIEPPDKASKEVAQSYGIDLIDSLQKEVKRRKQLK